MVTTLLWDGRYRLITAVLAGFGRAIAEVGAVMIVGGNIDHVTRTMTTAIALETSKGNIALALALGMILLAIALVVNAALMGIRRLANHFAYA
jgi:tungstate transport system permease protein